mgnify:CR=1 FL=1
MAHLHSENINGKNVIFYTDDTGIIWIRAFTLLQAVGLKAPGAALRSHINHRPGTGQKFNYPGHTTGDVEGKFTSNAWHFTYSEALEFLKSTRAAGVVKVHNGLEATVKALTAEYLARGTPAPAKTAKAKPAPVKTDTPYTATIDRLTAILTDTTAPAWLQLKALNARTLILELEKEGI